MSNLNSNAATAKGRKRYTIIPAYMGSDGQALDYECAICGEKFRLAADIAPHLAGPSEAWVCYPCVDRHDPAFHVRVYLERKMGPVDEAFRELDAALEKTKRALFALHTDVYEGAEFYTIDYRAPKSDDIEGINDLFTALDN